MSREDQVNEVAAQLDAAVRSGKMSQAQAMEYFQKNFPEIGSPAVRPQANEERGEVNSNPAEERAEAPKTDPSIIQHGKAILAGVVGQR